MIRGFLQRVAYGIAFGHRMALQLQSSRDQLECQFGQSNLYTYHRCIFLCLTYVVDQTFFRKITSPLMACLDNQ